MDRRPNATDGTSMNAGKGFQPATLTIANDAMRVVVAPTLGGKILSLQSRRTGREWLWSNPHLTQRSIPNEPSDFGQYDFGGWDEIFPSVAPCWIRDSAWGNRRITDHGLLWHRPWTCVDATESNASGHKGGAIAICVDDPTLPFRFERLLTLTAGTGPLIAEYILTNRGDSPLPYIWAAHPLVAVAAGMKIDLPSGTLMAVFGCVGFEMPSRNTTFTWPMLELADGKLMDFGRVPKATAAIAAKLFTGRLSEGWVRVVCDKLNETLQISFDPDVIPHVGMWANYSAWSGAGTEPYFNCGIEPTTSPADNLSDAILSSQNTMIPPRETSRWQLNVELLTGSS
jgi:hypothetical protein